MIVLNVFRCKLGIDNASTNVQNRPDRHVSSTNHRRSCQELSTAGMDLWCYSFNYHVFNLVLQVLVLAGSPHMRPPLVDLANLITKNNSLMVVGDIIEVNQNEYNKSPNLMRCVYCQCRKKFHTKCGNKHWKKDMRGWQPERSKPFSILCRASTSRQELVHFCKRPELVNWLRTSRWWDTNKIGWLVRQVSWSRTSMSCSKLNDDFHWEFHTKSANKSFIYF